ncbi:MAG: arylesterase [Gammaproteobacteria bacterium]
MAKTAKRLFICLMTLALVGCGSPKLEPLKPGAVILAFGDSLTAGVGAETSHSYPSVLAAMTGFTVINAGISGETTAQGLQRFPDVLNQHAPDLVILIEGGNDILRNRSKQQAKSNLEQMIQLAMGRNIQVVLLGVPEKSLFSSSAPFYAELAEKYNLAFDDETIGSLMRSPSMKSDAVHFNRAGYAEMAEQIYALLRDNGAF